MSTASTTSDAPPSAADRVPIASLLDGLPREQRAVLERIADAQRRAAAAVGAAAREAALLDETEALGDREVIRSALSWVVQYGLRAWAEDAPGQVEAAVSDLPVVSDLLAAVCRQDDELRDLRQRVRDLEAVAATSTAAEGGGW